jgi:hypothetical protein
MKRSLNEVACVLVGLSSSAGAWAQSVPGNVVTVDAGAQAGGTGQDWSSPIRSLQDAIDVVRDSLGAKNEIWVKAGTYYPDDCDSCGIQAPDRNAVFSLNSTFEDPDIKIRGGFAGDEALVSDRHIFEPANETILSGDIGTIGDPDDNSRLIVSLTDMTSATFLDAFTITRANNDLPSPPVDGAAIRLDDTSAVVMNCIVKENAAVVIVPLEEGVCVCEGSGAGLYVTGFSTGGPTITNTMLLDNTSVIEGGAVYVERDNPVLINCVIARNRTLGESIPGVRVAGRGGGLFVAAGSLTAYSCTITENESPECDRDEDADCGKGGGIYIDEGAAASFRNSILWCNAAHDSPCAGDCPECNLAGQLSGTPSIDYSVIQGYTGSGFGMGNTAAIRSSALRPRTTGA